MPFYRPTLPELVDRAITDIQSRLPSADALLRRSNLNVLSRVLAGAVHAIYGYLQWLAAQMMYDTAEAEYLERWASIWKINRVPASFATGLVHFTGSNGITVPAGTELQRGDGVLFTTDADVTLASLAGSVNATAVEAGAAGNTGSGSALTLTTPIAGVNSSATAGEISGGADAELDPALRARFLRRIQQPPHGGAKHDYIAWALEVPGVTRAWCYPGEQGAGTVTVRFVRDEDVSIIPDAGEVAAVQAHIEERRPVTALVYVGAPIAAPLNFTISVTPNTLAVKDAVAAELADLIKRESEPASTLLLSHIRAAISAAAGENNYVLTAPAADVSVTTGVMTTMGTISWL